MPALLRPFAHLVFVLLAGFWLGLHPVMAQPSGLDDLPPAAAARIADAPGLAAALRDRPGARVRIIVELAHPADARERSASLPGAAGDLMYSRGIHQLQDRVLGRVLGGGTDQAATAENSDPAVLQVARMQFVPVLTLTADAALLRRLAEDPEVVRIHHDLPIPPALDRSRVQIGATPVGQGTALGDGWHVAVLDTGIRRAHEFLRDRVVSAACYGTTDAALGVRSLCPGGVAQSTAIDSANDCDPATLRGCGHGTHVAGIAAGGLAQPRSGVPTQGVAPQARLISINVFSRMDAANCAAYGMPVDAGQQGCVLTFSSDILKGLERVYALRHQHRTAAVNLSVSAGLFESHSDCRAFLPAMDDMIGQLRAAGIITVAAAGNNSRTGAIGWPACLNSAVAVANATAEDTRFSGSNWSALVNLVAPGQRIQSAVVRGSSNISYGAMTGTSMATPHVAGALAALRSANPTASVNQLLTALQQTGTPITAGGVTRPRINLDLALDQLWGPPVATSVTLNGPSEGEVGADLVFTTRVTASRGIPQGSVSFRRNGVEFARATLDAAARATITTASIPAGDKQVTARYEGSTRHAASISPPLSLTVIEPLPVWAGFVGGGSLFAFTDACEASWGIGPQAVSVRYSPSELNELPSQVSIVWREGSEHLALWGPMAPSSQFFGAAGRGTWTRFVFYPTRPLIRVVQRQITAPAGGTDLAGAQELVLRLRVQNFGAIPDCAATLAAILYRED